MSIMTIAQRDFAMRSTRSPSTGSSNCELLCRGGGACSCALPVGRCAVRERSIRPTTYSTQNEVALPYSNARARRGRAVMPRMGASWMGELADINQPRVRDELWRYLYALTCEMEAVRRLRYEMDLEIRRKALHGLGEAIDNPQQLQEDAIM